MIFEEMGESGVLLAALASVDLLYKEFLSRMWVCPILTSAVVVCHAGVCTQPQSIQSDVCVY